MLWPSSTPGELAEVERDLAAAVAAARNGASVVLLERYPYLGGQCTGGLVVGMRMSGGTDKIEFGGLHGSFDSNTYAWVNSQLSKQ